jgi:hypothetical protein
VAFHDCPMPGKNKIKLILFSHGLAGFNVETVIDKMVQIDISLEAFTATIFKETFTGDSSNRWFT